jgi:hypothetical protein
MKNIFVITIAYFFLISCGKIKTSNTVGNWYNKTSRNMDGYDISSEKKLTIIRIDAGVYEYKLATTVIDQMNGGRPNNKYSFGKFEEYIKDNKWVFNGGFFGNRGGYVEVPSDHWDNYKPETLTVHFASVRGDSMNFSRNE